MGKAITGKLHRAALTGALALSGCQTTPLATLPSLNIDASVKPPSEPAYMLFASTSQTPAEPGSVAVAYCVYSNSVTHDLDMVGSNNVIDGSAHSNCGMKLAGNQETITGNATSVGGIRMSGNRCGVHQQQTVAPKTWSAVMNCSQWAPTFHFNGDVDLDSRPECWESRTQLKPGIYTCTGKLTLSRNGCSGNVTLVGRCVKLTGNNHTLKPYRDNVLCYATGHDDDAVHVAGANGRYTGLCLSYNGQCQISGHNNWIAGGVECDRFKCAGSDNRITNQGQSCNPPSACHTHKGHGTPTPKPTPTPRATPTPKPTPTPKATPTPHATPTPGHGATPTPCPTTRPTVTPSAAPTPIPTPVASPAPTATPTPDGGPVPTPTPVGSPTLLPPPTQPSGTTWSLFGFGNLFGLAFDAQGQLWASATGMPAHGIQFDGSGNQQGATELGIDAWGVAVQESTGRVWYTDKGSCQVTVLNADRSVAFTVGMGEASVPEGIAFDAQGNPWITDFGNGVVDKLDPATGTIVSSYPVGSGPRGIAFDANGVAWVTNYLSDTVSALNPDGSTVGTFAVPDHGPCGVGVDRDDNVWVSCFGADLPAPNGSLPSKTVSEFDDTGVWEGTYDVGNSPFGIAFDHAGNTLVVNTLDNSVTKLDPNGMTMATYTQGIGLHPYNIAVDGNGVAWIAAHDDGTLTALVP